MALYQLRNPEPPIEAFPDSNGNFYIVQDNGIVKTPPIPRAEFEAQYVPFVKPVA